MENACYAENSGTEHRKVAQHHLPSPNEILSCLSDIVNSSPGGGNRVAEVRTGQLIPCDRASYILGRQLDAGHYWAKGLTV